MEIVNKPLQRISNVSRTLVPETSVVVSVGKVQFVENVEAEAKSLPHMCFGWPGSMAFLSKS
jgi:hypothetical protein